MVYIFGGDFNCHLANIYQFTKFNYIYQYLQLLAKLRPLHQIFDLSIYPLTHLVYPLQGLVDTTDFKELAYMGCFQEFA